MRRGATVHLASTDRSISDTSLGVRPIIMTRLVDDTGCSMVGGFETCGSANACVSRSPTT